MSLSTLYGQLSKIESPEETSVRFFVWLVVSLFRSTKTSIYHDSRTTVHPGHVYQAGPYDPLVEQCDGNHKVSGDRREKNNNFWWRERPTRLQRVHFPQRLERKWAWEEENFMMNMVPAFISWRNTWDCQLEDHGNSAAISFPISGCWWPSASATASSGRWKEAIKWPEEEPARRGGVENGETRHLLRAVTLFQWLVGRLIY